MARRLHVRRRTRDHVLRKGDVHRTELVEQSRDADVADADAGLDGERHDYHQPQSITHVEQHWVRRVMRGANGVTTHVLHNLYLALNRAVVHRGP